MSEQGQEPVQELEIEFVWVRYKRKPAIKIPVEELDSYLAQGYVVIPIRDEPSNQDS